VTDPTPFFDATANDLFVHLSTTPVVILYVDAVWNHSVRSTKNALEGLSQVGPSEIRLLTLDLDDPRNEMLLRRLRVFSVPFVAVYLDGELFRTYVGDAPRRCEQGVREAVAGIPWYWRRSPA
jgi:thioredoxin-like negative regulator of GroEL